MKVSTRKNNLARCASEVCYSFSAVLFLPPGFIFAALFFLHWCVLLRQRVDNLHRLDAHPHDLAHEADDVFFVVGIVRIAGDAAPLIGADLVLVDHPVERAAVPQAILDASN